MRHVILYENGQFKGYHKHAFSDEPDLNRGDDLIINHGAGISLQYSISEISVGGLS
ncbi:MAG TPA: hypothetical protein VH796_02520 [Nitrososphaeraceae archaeon]|jgi:hypothetical protein